MIHQEVAADWHLRRFPTATIEQVLLKSTEELGECHAAYNTWSDTDYMGGKKATEEDFINEAADTVVTLLVAVGRYTSGDLMRAVEAKLTKLMTPGAHRGSLEAA